MSARARAWLLIRRTTGATHPCPHEVFSRGLCGAVAKDLRRGLKPPLPNRLRRHGDYDTVGRRAIGSRLADDSAMGWEADLEAKHGMPLDQIPGHVYVLHYEIPQIVKSVSGDYAGASARGDANGFLSATPIRHYVGWTQQRVPRKRINRHGTAALREIVYLQPGTTQDEQTMKLSGTCSKCGESLAASLTRPPGLT
jgi:hypothetical protein